MTYKCINYSAGGRGYHQELGELSLLEETKNQEAKSKKMIKAQYEAQLSSVIR
jgi:hypothetical protein